MMNLNNVTPGSMVSFILKYKEATYIVLNEQCQTGIFSRGAIEDCNYQVTAFDSSSDRTGVLLEINLPPIAKSDNKHDVIALADTMGYFKYGASLIDKLQNSRQFKINGQYWDTRLGEYWEEEMLESFEQCGYDTMIYYAESKPDYGEGEAFEIEASFREICEATTEDGKSWKLVADGKMFEITFP